MDFRTLQEKVKRKLLYKLNLEKRLSHWESERYLKLMYLLRFGKRLDLENPVTFSEKLQWLKLNYQKPEFTRMVDKHDAKSWAMERIGKNHIVPLLGVWDSFDEIDFNELPNQFVLKCTHNSGGIVICKDKTSLDLHSARVTIERALERNYFLQSREWPYRDVPPRIIAEVYLPSWHPDGSIAVHQIEDGAGVLDYKFYCFNGRPEFILVSQHHGSSKGSRVDFLACDWSTVSFERTGVQGFPVIPKKPERLNDMLRLAKELSTGLPFVRVDLFEHFGEILFSEMTFFPAGGMSPFSPKGADAMIGRLLELPQMST